MKAQNPSLPISQPAPLVVDWLTVKLPTSHARKVRAVASGKRKLKSVNFHSLRFRLIGWYAGLFLLLVTAFGIYSHGRLDYYLSHVLTEVLEHRAHLIGNNLVANIPQTGEKFVGDEIEARYAPELNDRFIRVTRGDGKVIYRSGVPNDKSFDPGKIAAATMLPYGKTIKEVVLDDGARLLIASLVFNGGAQHYIVEVGSSEAAMNQVLQGYLETLLIGLPIVLGVAVLGGYILIERALYPVRRMISSSREITLHRLNHRLPVARTGDEIESLSTTLNEMIGRIEESVQSTVRFTADASHELRTPLTIVRGELEALLAYKDLPEHVVSTLDSLMEETNRLGKIVEGLLSLSRLDAGAGRVERIKFDLAELAATTAEQMCLLAVEKEIAVEIETDGPVWMEGDRSRLKQVIVNLLDNAIKYTPNGGRIWVDVRAEDEHALLEVSDTGPGIREEAIPYVFDRFFRAENVRAGEVEGAGLGLSIVKAICTAHRGTISARNVSSGGCTVTAKFPKA